MDKLKRLVLKNRFTVLVATLAVYMSVLVVEGALTGREARVVDFDNPFFDLSVDLEQLENLRQNREGGRQSLRD